ncbi:MAG: vitamin B12 dependent-methionine synthase activation domain-containing protein [Bacillota bacterium]
MNPVILDKIPFEIDLDKYLKLIRVSNKPDYAEKATKLVAEAQSIARPKAMYREAFIEAKGDNFVIVNGTTFTSRVLRVNLNDVYRVFPYVATSGVEIEEWSEGIEDMLERFWADTIKEMALRVAMQELFQHFKENCYLGNTSTMNPGSLQDWPIQEQSKLFKVLGNSELVGIRLSETFLMYPIKSVSGIIFPTEVNFVNCQLCSRENCPGRKAPYDKHLYKEKFA